MSAAAPRRAFGCVGSEKRMPDVAAGLSRRCRTPPDPLLTPRDPLQNPCSWESWMFITLVTSVLDFCAPHVLYNTP
eukprot:9232618-Pyramimonas_sp.AAC.1